MKKREPDLSKPWCYWINEGQEPDPEHGYIPSIVVERDPGHYPLVGRGPYATPWYWGDLDMAQKIAKEQNEKMGVSEERAILIVASSIGASMRRPWSDEE